MSLQFDDCNLEVKVFFKSAACTCTNSALVLNFIKLIEVSRQLLEVKIFYEQRSKAWLQQATLHLYPALHVDES